MKNKHRAQPSQDTNTQDQGSKGGSAGREWDSMIVQDESVLDRAADLETRQHIRDYDAIHKNES